MEKNKVRTQLNIEHADIGFRNFVGEEGPYNKSGDRSFVVFLDDELAAELEAEGWNIKWPKENDKIDPEEDERRPYFQVTISFKYYPAKVYLINDDNPDNPSVEMIEEEAVGMLDWAELSNVDLVIRPYNWTMQGNSGVKAYLKAGYFTLVSDEFAKKYGV